MSSVCTSLAVQTTTSNLISLGQTTSTSSNLAESEFKFPRAQLPSVEYCFCLRLPFVLTIMGVHQLWKVTTTLAESKAS